VAGPPGFQLGSRRAGTYPAKFLFAGHPDHCRSGPLESPHQSVEPGCGFVEAFEHVDLAVLADKLDGDSVAVRMKPDAPGQDGVRRQIQRGELLLDAGFDIDRDEPLNGVLRRRLPVEIERNERQRCLIKNAGSWGLLVAPNQRNGGITPAPPQARDDSVALLSMFDDVRDQTSAAKEWDRLINLPAGQPKDHACQNQARSREREIPPGRPFHLAINLLAIHRYGESESPRTF